MKNLTRKATILLLLVFTTFSTLVIAQSQQQVQARVDSLNKKFKETYYSDPALATKLLNEAMELSIKNGYTFGEACAHSNLGTNYFKEGNNTKAIEECITALSLFDKDEAYKNTADYGMVFVRLAAALNVENDSKRSKAYSQKAVAIANKLNDREFLAIAQETLGNSYYSGGQSDSALHYFTIAKTNFTETGSFSKIANLENNIGLIYADKGDYKQTLAHFERALSIYREHNRHISYVTAFNNIAEIHYRLKAYNKALDAADSATYYAKKYNTQGSFIDLYNLKAQIYGAMGNVDSSAVYFEKTIAQKDSLYNDTYKKELASLQTQSDVYKTETENKLLTKDKRIAVLYRNLAIAGIVVLAVILAFLLLNQRLRIQRRVKHQLEEEVALRTQEIFRQKETIFQTNLRLKLALNGAKFDSHFAVHTLNTIQQVILQQKSDAAQHHLAKLSHLMQYVLEKSPLERVPLHEELQMIEHYIQLEQLRQQHHFSYGITIKANEQTMIPALLLQPYVENAIRHRLASSTKEDLHLHLQVETDGNDLTVSITDNGSKRMNGKETKKQFEENAIGQERLDLLTHLTHKNHLVTIDDLTTNDGSSAGTKIVLHIPMQANSISPDLTQGDQPIEYA
ncbi:tetratricopeptide repeat-containing sensor histidine kinase [Flavisolibacter tropicus]|uniref:Signal transduction histidine kinase internal region domain-containing protein n=1 Tax=Flavisolibacter tropicus TaxID=1492898 RepID=A0A172TUV9_9BACT|nr:tetratricopeptide repeat protein [Flavisolibacter tropicus]ANE50563.1 hypothetical protein SY85_08655 [Flavisolibacter tropicus]